MSYPCRNVTCDRPTSPEDAMGSSRNGPCPELNSIAGSSDWAAFTVGEQVILCAQLLTFLGRFPKKTEISRTLDLENPEMNNIFSILSWFMWFLMIWKGHLFLVSVRIECVLRSMALDLKFQSQHSHHLHERSTWKKIIFDLNLTKKIIAGSFLKFQEQ